MLISLPSSTLFPYTTLFRSVGRSAIGSPDEANCDKYSAPSPTHASKASRKLSPLPDTFPSGARSEEHTSELQSQSKLVCRLLLEKKKRSDVPIFTTVPSRYH